jgi:hypothetical protein
LIDQRTIVCFKINRDRDIDKDEISGRVWLPVKKFLRKLFTLLTTN